MRRILVFDVNETLLDLHALEPHFEKLLGDRAALREWFNQLIGFAEALTLMDIYRPFSEVARAALEMTAAAQGLQASDLDIKPIVETMRTLPPHPEVPGALERLRNAGARMVALTNSPPQMAEAQIRNAGLDRFFERIFSVDSVRRYKPAPEPYRMVASELRVTTSELRMVAAHAWDIGGAMHAGCAGAFVARPGKALFPLLPAPDVIGEDLAQVAGVILALEPAQL
jgi:2-haloacid dehalogenase